MTSLFEHKHFAFTYTPRGQGGKIGSFKAATYKQTGNYSATYLKLQCKIQLVPKVHKTVNVLRHLTSRTHMKILNSLLAVNTSPILLCSLPAFKQTLVLFVCFPGRDATGDERSVFNLSECFMETKKN